MLNQVLTAPLTLRRRLFAAGFAIWVVLLALILNSPAAFAAPGPTGGGYSSEEVSAITESGVVLIQEAWTGYIGVPQTDGTIGWVNQPTTTYVSCSGFVAESSGYVVTAGHCVDPQLGRQYLIQQALADAVGPSLSQAQADAILPEALSTWKVQGQNDGDPIALTVQVYQLNAASGIQTTQPLTASKVDARLTDQGDVALLKVQTPAPMPALKVADSVPTEGSDISMMGFPATISQAVDPSMTPSFKTGKVSALQTINGVPFIQIDTTTDHGMSGGPVVNPEGEVVGIASRTPDGESFSLVASQDTIHALLKRNGVDPALTQSDQDYRDGVHKFFAGDYSGAAASFDKVLAVVPSHASAQKFRAKAMQEEQSQTTSPVATPTVVQTPATVEQPVVVASSTPAGTDLPIAVWGAIAAGLIAAAVLAFILVRKQRSGPHLQPAGHLPFEVSTSEDTASPAPHHSEVSGAVDTCLLCGEPNPLDSRFCRKCGVSLRNQVPVPNGESHGD
jgi:hypothetical protein